MSHTAPEKDQIFTGGLLSSRSSNYRIEAILSQGSFGKVAKCTRMADVKRVAVKMIKNHGLFASQAKQEVAMLIKLKSLDRDKCHLVQWYRSFIDKGYICLEFEHLDKSLYDFMAQRLFRPIPLTEIRPVVQQLANALHHLKSVGIIHADIKLENVMLVNHPQEPYRVKLIDFGLACTVSDTRQGLYTQSRTYRAPEILLGLPYTEAIDMWSLGILVAFLFLGSPLYPGQSEYDMIRYIVDTHGQPSDKVLNMGSKTPRFFKRVFSTSLWKLRTPEQIHQETGITPVEKRRWKIQSLNNLLNIGLEMRKSSSSRNKNAGDDYAEIADLHMFVDMLKGMLQLDASHRITPLQAMRHQYISMRHIQEIYAHSSYTKFCAKVMARCLPPDGWKTASETSQQPFSGAAHSTQQNCPPPPAERSSQPQPPPPPQHRRPDAHPPSRSQAESLAQSGVKRKSSDAEDAQAKTGASAACSDRKRSKWMPEEDKKKSDTCVREPGTAHAWRSGRPQPHQQRPDAPVVEIKYDCQKEKCVTCK